MNDISKELADAVARQILGATIAWGGGQYYDFENPNPEIISFEDAAYAWAYTVRWRGQARVNGRRPFYGVGQHLVFGVEEMLRAGHSTIDTLGFLFHESDEVVFPDMPGPAKNLMPDFKRLASHHGMALIKRFGIAQPDVDLCKRWDMRMMVTEKRDLMPGHGLDWFQTSKNETVDENEFPPFERRIVPYPHPEQAAIRLIALYNQLRHAA